MNDHEPPPVNVERQREKLIKTLTKRNSMLVSIVGMALYTGYVFMPQHIMAILHYFEIVQ